jgi:hypothetical protein
VQNVTLKSIALGCLIAVSVVVDCSDKNQPHAVGSAGGAEPDASQQGGQGGDSRTPENYAGESNAGATSGGSGSASSGASGMSSAGEGGAESTSGAAGISNAGAAGDRGGLELPDASASDAANSDADIGAGGSRDSEHDAGLDASLPKDAAPDMNCPVPIAPTPRADAGVATRSDVQSILDLHCTLCHTEPDPPMGLVLTDVAAVVGSHSMECTDKLRIAPGSSENSYLIDKVLYGSQTPCGCFMDQGMPLDNDPLSDDEVRTIVSWINGGAH